MRRLLAIFAVVLWASVAHAAIVEVNVADNGDFSGTASASLTSTAASLTGGNAIVVMVAWALDNQTVTGVSDTAGNTYASVVAHTNGSDQWIQIWAATNVTGNGANVVTITMSGTVRYWGVNTIQYSGLVTSSVAAMTDLTATGTGSGLSVTSGTWGPTSQANEVIVASVRNSSGGGTFTPDTGFSIAVQDDTTSTAIESSIVSTTQSAGSTVSMSYSSSTAWVMAVAAFKEAGGGGGGGSSRSGTFLGFGMGR